MKYDDDFDYNNQYDNLEQLEAECARLRAKIKDLKTGNADLLSMVIEKNRTIDQMLMILRNSLALAEELYQ